MMKHPAYGLLALCLGATAAEQPVTADPAAPASPWVLWFDSPAPRMDKPRVAIEKTGTDTPLAREARHFDFHHALPLGNGRLGAMDFGGVGLWRVALNESGVWSGGEYEWNQHDAHEHLPEIRRLLFADRVEKAFRLVDKNFVWAKGTKRFEPTQFGCYQTLGDLLIAFPESETHATAYRRELDLMSGIASTSYERGEVKHERRLVVSKPAEIIAMEIKAAWNGDFHSNINLQMNYWPAGPTHLAECHLPLMRLIRTAAAQGEKTARAYYDAPGWVIHHTQNPWGYSAPSNAMAGSGSTCGAWLCHHIWTHYEYTRDLDFLREHLPALTG